MEKKRKQLPRNQYPRITPEILTTLNEISNCDYDRLSEDGRFYLKKLWGLIEQEFENNNITIHYTLNEVNYDEE